MGGGYRSKRNGGELLMAIPVPAVFYRNYDDSDTTVFNEPLLQMPTLDDLRWESKTGCKFKEWNTARNGSGASYQPGDQIPSGISEFYAIWQADIVYLTNGTELTSIADAIRTKGGTSASLEYPDGFVTAINAISTGTDVSDTTATAADVLAGKYFYTANGTRTQGSIATKTSSNMTANGATVTAPAGYYASSASKAVASGSATTPATTITAQPSISVSALGLITATNSKTQSVTPTVSAGYVSAGTAGTITVSGSNTSQLPTQAAQTITPTTTDQTIASGKYLTGAQTIKGDANLIAENIAKDVTIFGVTGTHEGGGGSAVTTVEFGDESIFEGDYIDYVDGDGTHQSTTSLANMSATTYQMLSGSLLVLISATDPAMIIWNQPSTLRRVAVHTLGSRTNKVWIWIYQVA